MNAFSSIRKLVPAALCGLALSTGLLAQEAGKDYTVDNEWAQLPAGKVWEGNTSWILPMAGEISWCWNARIPISGCSRATAAS